MSLLTICQQVMKRNGLQYPATIVGNNDDTAALLLERANEAVGLLGRSGNWPQLIKLASITLVTGQSAYALPADFDAFFSDTMWNQDDHWPLRGSISPEEWNERQYGYISSMQRQKWRIKGFADKTFYVTPTPDADSNGHVISFEYLTSIWTIPKTWVTSTAFGATTYCSCNGNIYYTTAGGTTGANPPVHTTGSASDGTVTWIYWLGPRRDFVADTDTPNFDEDLVKDMVEWAVLRAKGLSYQEQKAAAEQAMRERIAALRGSGPFTMGYKSSVRFISGYNIPDSGWGN